MRASGYTVVHDGMVFGGVPVGTPEYVESETMRRVSVCLAGITTTSEKLCAPDPQSMWHLLRVCLGRRADFLAAHVYPSESSVAMGAFDLGVRRAALQAFAAAGESVAACRVALERLAGPFRLGGGGLRPASRVAEPGFVGRVYAVAARLGSLGPRGSGAALFGAEAFTSPRRFEGLVAGRGGAGPSTRLGREFRAAWNRVRAVAARARGVGTGDVGALGVLAFEAHSAGRAANPEGANVDAFGYLPGGVLQGAVTARLEEALDVRLRGRLGLADLGKYARPAEDAFAADAFRAARTSRAPCQVLAALPTRAARQLTPRVWSECVAAYLGVPSPACSRLGPVPLREGGRLLDRYGAALLGGGEGDRGGRRTAWHDGMVRCVVRSLRRAGVECSEVGRAPFVAEGLPREAVQRLSAERAAGPQMDELARCVRQMTPDAEVGPGVFAGEPPPRFVDVKTLSWTPLNYAPLAKRPVDSRADQVPVAYRRAARGIDASLIRPGDAAPARARGAPPGRGSDVPAAAPGPLEQALAAAGGVRGVVFGWFGEPSKSAVHLLRKAAAGFLAQSDSRGDPLARADPDRALALYVSELWRDWGVEAARLRAEAVLALLPRPCLGSKLSSLELECADAFHLSALDAARGFAASLASRELEVFPDAPPSPSPKPPRPCLPLA